jgi:amino acid adenylation domain-containing protein
VNNKLHQYIEEAIHRYGENVYLKTTSAQYTYIDVYKLALELQSILMLNGIRENDRVIIYSVKNVESIAMMIACSLCHCIYVPVSSQNPGQRIKYIIQETTPRFILCDDASGAVLKKTGLDFNIVNTENRLNLYSVSSANTEYPNFDEAAFILFTSGSTGTPKGVIVSHQAAIVFIDWAAEEFHINHNDRVASIAPFNFDLSVFDIYVTAKKSATLLLFTEEETKNALLIAQNIALEKTTTIYATPTFYSTLAYYGKLHKYDYSSLKNVLFAGEIFHLPAFRELLIHWPGKNYVNLYGPTETNVCTFYKVLPENINYPVFPIGKPCPFALTKIIDEYENEITENNIKGELIVAGESIFNGYWNDSEKTKTSFIVDQNQTQYYKTGDIVFKNDENDYVYVIRKDRMIKKNGFRIEPSEIEKVMIARDGISNTSVLFSEENNQVICFIERMENTNEDFIALKKFCQEYLPAYMIPDKFVFLNVLPKTASGKVDLQALKKLV